MTILKNLFTPSRVGFLLAALAVTTMSFCQLDAMKRKHGQAVEPLAIEAQQQTSPFEQTIDCDTTAYILSLALDCSSPEALLVSIQKFRRICITNLKTFVQALEMSLRNAELSVATIPGSLSLETMTYSIPNHPINPFIGVDDSILDRACEQKDIDSVMIILLASMCPSSLKICRFHVATLPIRKDYYPGYGNGSIITKFNTPLHRATNAGDAELVKILIESLGEQSWDLICLNFKDRSLDSAWNIAKEHKHYKILALFAKEYLKHQARVLWDVASSALTEGSYNFL